ncbi:MAG TPA: bifunctional DNA-formamidopyrimidine glycosylase/DNA-(apurinic or apyrimidinic site) lyase [Candidatus Kapabacteria bacterium]|nr:bifunctional DNA-formamidopyrimidine glycosylase/DNA-(apurinic or apyrimidinic site) lyase [Candidatus Kapabacteria bacterium]
MPELPEVETIRRGLEPRLRGRQMKTVQLLNIMPVQNDPAFFISALEGNTIRSIGRIGKLLLFHLGSDHTLLIHLKMTGRLIYQDHGTVMSGGHSLTKIKKHLQNTHIIFSFEDGSTLSFADTRRLGYVRIVTKPELETVMEKFGIEPLTDMFTRERFFSLIKGKRPIKALLLDQSAIAGIGNIYADEICFCAGVRPDRLVSTLTEEEIGKLYDACGIIIQNAIDKRGTTFKNYVGATGKEGSFYARLNVYGRAKKECRRCGNALTPKRKIAGRSTVYCLSCQA